MGNVYALLVGIDRYEKPSPLYGCVNDVEAMANYLEVRFGTNRDRLHLEILTNEQAKRQAILETFRGHLTQARRGDTALFFYAGHGGREKTPPMFQDIEADGLDETLVAWDSRLAGGWDIADKELAVLIAEAAQREAHMAVVLDSCHSGTATRLGYDGVVRRAPTHDGARPAGTFWFLQSDAGLSPTLDVAGGWRVLPRGRHVLLSACRDFEQARETTTPEDTRRGIFSYNLIQALRQLNGQIRYRDLHKRVQTLVSNHSGGEQVPQAEGDLEGLLFNGAMPGRPPVFYVRNVRNAGWRLDAGAMHGIQPGSELAVFPPGTEALEDLEKKLATVRVSAVGPAESELTVQGELTHGEVAEVAEVAFPGILTRLPYPPLKVKLDPSAAGEELEKAVRKCPFLAREEPADVLVLGGRGVYRLRRPEASRDLAPPLTGAREVVDALVQIARWEIIRTLQNPGSELAGAVRMTVSEWKRESLTALPEGDEARLIYRETEKGQEAPRFAVEIRNTGKQALYYALLGLDSNFGVTMVEGSTGQLAGGHTVWVRKVDGIPAEVPDRYYLEGVTQRLDHLVLLVSEIESDFHLLKQEGLGSTYSSRNLRSDRSPGVLDVLMWRVGYREVDRQVRSVKAHQWAVQIQTLVTERPAPRVDVAGYRGFDVNLGGEVWLTRPGDFRADAQLLNAPSAARTLGSFLTPPPLPGVPARTLALAGRLASDGGLSVLELKGEDFSSVTAGEPLRISASHTDIEPGEVPLAVAFDGLDYWLVGSGRGARSNGYIAVEIPALPQPLRAARLPEARRHLAGRVWLLFLAAREKELPVAWAEPGGMRKLQGV